jgi:hypothetical protein
MREPGNVANTAPIVGERRHPDREGDELVAVEYADAEGSSAANSSSC